MRPDLVSRKIKRVHSIVRTIERLRSDLFVKFVPPLFQEGYARLVVCPPAAWVVITADKDYLEKIDSVKIDHTEQELERQLKFFDEDGNEMYPPPQDIVAMYTLSSERVRQDVINNNIDSGRD